LKPVRNTGNAEKTHANRQERQDYAKNKKPGVPGALAVQNKERRTNMTRAGFVDHHLNNFHADKFLSLFRGPLACQEVEIAFAWESDPAGDDWCAQNGVKRLNSPEEVAQAADGVMILAPDNIEEHLKLCRRVFPARKPTFVDKFLAPCLAEAREIVRLSKDNGTPIASSSALRYAVELEAALGQIKETPTEMYARGMGNWGGYGVHTVAMVLRVMGASPKRLIDTGTPTARTITLDYGDGRRAHLDVRTAANEWEVFPWQFGIRAGDRYTCSTIADYDGFYANEMKAVAAFLKSGQPGVPVEEALMMVAILEGASCSQQAGGEWIALVI